MVPMVLHDALRRVAAAANMNLVEYRNKTQCVAILASSKCHRLGNICSWAFPHNELYWFNQKQIVSFLVHGAMNMNRTQALTLLHVEDGASDDDINRAFRKLALGCHPDNEGGDEDRFKELGCARDILTGKLVPRPRVPASDAHRFVVYRIEGLTFWKTRRVYIGLVDTAKKSVAVRVQEHRCRGSSCAAWLRAVIELTWKRVDSAPTMLQGLQKEAVHTGWELRLEDGACMGAGYRTVRGACVVIISEKHARSTNAWQRQLAAARELSVLPSNMDSALSYFRTVKAKLPRDIVYHLEGRCHICSEQ